ncbi:Peregrin [Termitomyces sp. J132]|nr:Peregrin [Termitomyces sp. J132]
MARGAHASPPLSSLPKVSFIKIDDDVSTRPCGVHDGQARAFGYNDFSEFQRPDSYIRHIEPLESELAKQVEYDMDEQDKEWLDSLNRERRKEQMSQVSYELFEVVMDRLEKEWFDLTKNIPKPDLALPSEDSTCAVCDDSEGENSNAIVFCDGCNLAVHQDCYGVPYIPEGQWLCRKCTVSPENPVSCRLCPNEGGAFKQTVSGEWVHLLCAIWVPETRVANEVFMEPVTGIDKISKQRWRLKCHICNIQVGACIQCSKASCVLAFHATCARRDRLLMPMKAAHGAEPVSLACFCDRHLPKEQQETRTAALAADEQLQDSPSHNAKLAKSARAYAKTYKPGPPLVPAVVVDRIDFYVRRFKMTKRIPTIQMMCRYWSLKREARRGAPLLKRLHLEPWTASAGGKPQTDEEKVMKLDQLSHLLYDLEGLKDLTFSTKKRERWKLEQIRTVCNVLDSSFFVHERRLRAGLERIMNLDRQEYFRNPVSRVEVPDYFDIVQNPMCWVMIEAKLDKHQYWDVDVFKRDVDLVVDNAILYNKPGTPFHKAALRIQNAVPPILQELYQPDNPADDSEADPANSIGDLEPPLDLLEILLSPQSIQDDMDLVIDDTPIASLFSLALPKFKPPPPPPLPPTPPLPRQFKKRGRKLRKRFAEAADGYSSLPGILTGVPMDETLVVGPTEEHAQGADEPTEREMEEPVEQSLPPPASAVSVSIGPAKRERGSRQSRPKNDALPLVDDVNNHQSFKMFNEGWILPPEQKRGGRVSMDRQNVVVTPRPRKRMRTDAGPSRLSVVSTAATEGQTVPGTPGTLDAPVDAPPLASPASRNTPSLPAAEVSPETPAQGEILLPTNVPISKSLTEETKTALQIEAESQEPRTEQAQSPEPPGVGAVSQREAESEEPGRPQHVPLTSSTPGTSDAAVLAMTNATAAVTEKSNLNLQTVVPDTGACSLGAQEPPKIGPENSSAHPADIEEPPHPEREPISDVNHAPSVDPREAQFPESRFDNPNTPSDDLDIRSVAHQEPREAVTHHDLRIPSAPAPAPVSQEPFAKDIPEVSEPADAYEPEAAETEDDDDDDDAIEVDLPQDESVFVPISATRPRRRPSSPTNRRISVSDAPPLSATETERVIEENGRKVLEMLDTPELRRKKAIERKKQLKERKQQQVLDGGTIVWAQAKSFPWWPGVIWDENHPEVPLNIRAELTKAKRRFGPDVHIVQFFDKHRSWQLLPNDSLRMLAEDKELDEDMIADKSKRQKTKWTHKNMQECRASYQIALQEMETVSDLENVNTAVVAPPPIVEAVEGTMASVE